jgi:DNA-binding transcriptional ArsR family regulator
MADAEIALDRLVHEPGRLAILTVLSSVSDADFLFLQRTTGLTKGNLSSHLAKLEDGGLVTITKRFVRKKPNTVIALTEDGKRRVARHWEQLERLRRLGAS